MRSAACREALLYDNLKTAVLERQGTSSASILACSSSRATTTSPPSRSPVARGNEKGRVERAIRYLRDSFFAARSFVLVDDLNRQLAAWIVSVRPRTRRSRATPTSALVADGARRRAAAPLPAAAHPSRERPRPRPSRSGKTPYIRFDRNDYSIPHTLVQKPLTLVASESAVRVLDGDRDVARHAALLRSRSSNRGRAATSRPRGSEAPRARAPRAQPTRSVCAQRAGVPRRGRAARRPSRRHHHPPAPLLDQYGAAELDAAIADALGRGAFAAQSVAHVLDQRRRAAERRHLSSSVAPRRPARARLPVTPHSLASLRRARRSSSRKEDEP